MNFDMVFGLRNVIFFEDIATFFAPHSVSKYEQNAHFDDSDPSSPGWSRSVPVWVRSCFFQFLEGRFKSTGRTAFLNEICDFEFEILDFVKI